MRFTIGSPIFISQAEIPSCILISGACSRCLKILGNPFYLNDEVCKRLKEYGCRKYQLSLDGLRETHDWFRKPGSFGSTLEKIDCIKRAGIRSVIMTTVSGTNRKEIPDLIDTVVERGADIFAFARYCPTSEEKDTGMTPQEYRELLDICHQKFEKYEAEGCSTYFNRKDHLWTLYEYEKGIFKIPSVPNIMPRRIYANSIGIPSLLDILFNDRHNKITAATSKI